MKLDVTYTRINDFSIPSHAITYYNYINNMTSLLDVRSMLCGNCLFEVRLM